MYKLCQYCGKSFFTYQKERKYCSYGCAKAAKYKKDYKCSVSNSEFKELYNLYKEKIRKLIFKRLVITQYFDECLQDALISLWLCALRHKEKNKNIGNISNVYITNMLINVIFKRNGRDIANYNKLSQIHKNILSENTILYANSDTTIADTMEYKTIPVDKLMDLKSLTTKIMCEGCLDKDVKFAIIRAEESGSNFKEKSYEKILEEYGINISPKAFTERARFGSQKLYAKYKEEIKELTNITEKELKFKEKNNYFEPRICSVCGRIFLPVTPWQEFCSKKCLVTKHNADRNARTKKQVEQDLLESIKQLRKEREKLKIEVNNKKQQVQYYTQKLKK